MTSIKQIKQTLEAWQHIIDFGYGTIEVPNETKIFKTILNLIDKQQKEIEELKKYDYRNIKIEDNNKIYSIHFTKEQLHWMNFGIALYVSMQNFDKINDENDV